MKKTVKFTETVLRDANQSLIATRMAFDEFEPILSELDNAGYYSLECWGGATFDSCLRYLNEDPWERLRKIKKACPKTPLQMLLRGQNLLGYKHYPDDVVRMFVRKSVENGIDIIRIFDALNDIRNIEVAVDETLKCGAHASGCICYTISPIHNLESYVKLAKEIEALGVQSICVKDMAGIMSPKEAYDLVSALKDAGDLPIDVHTHSTPGLGFMTYLKAVEAGADNYADDLQKILDTDSGSRYTGEFAFGLNPFINRAVGDTLFDEKISGSVHLALGNFCGNACNGNRSGIHWDLVQIQTPEYGGGEIWFDDVLIRKDGLFVLPELQDLNP